MFWTWTTTKNTGEDFCVVGVIIFHLAVSHIRGDIWSNFQIERPRLISEIYFRAKCFLATLWWERTIKDDSNSLGDFNDIKAHFLSPAFSKENNREWLSVINSNRSHDAKCPTTDQRRRQSAVINEAKCCSHQAEFAARLLNFRNRAKYNRNWHTIGVGIIHMFTHHHLLQSCQGWQKAGLCHFSPWFLI